VHGHVLWQVDDTLLSLLQRGRLLTVRTRHPTMWAIQCSSNFRSTIRYRACLLVLIRLISLYHCDTH
jgi:hypothetical protein